MAEQFYFMFSNGEYSDYCVGGMFVCDHEVSQGDWEVYYKQFQDYQRQARNTAIAEFCIRVGCGWRESTGECGEVYIHAPSSGKYKFYGSDEYYRLTTWQKENEPESNFQLIHGMKEVGYTEMWRG